MGGPPPRSTTSFKTLGLVAEALSLRWVAPEVPGPLWEGPALTLARVLAGVLPDPNRLLWGRPRTAVCPASLALPADPAPRGATAGFDHDAPIPVITMARNTQIGQRERRWIEGVRPGEVLQDLKGVWTRTGTNSWPVSPQCPRELSPPSAQPLEAHSYAPRARRQRPPRLPPRLRVSPSLYRRQLRHLLPSYLQRAGQGMGRVFDDGASGTDG
jgi:hypothetical protein